MDDPRKTLTAANTLFNKGDQAGAAALYVQICAHPNLPTVPKTVLIAASRTLGYQYSNGLGIPQDLRRAVDAYRIAVALDDPASTCNLASLWFEGVPSVTTFRAASGTPLSSSRSPSSPPSPSPAHHLLRQDHIRGAKLLGRLLSRVEYVPALVELGRCYFTGEGVAFDPKRATQLWTRAHQLAVSGTYVLQTKEDLVPAISECQRALKEVRALGERPEQFNAYQESTLEGNATDKGRYGPYTSPWGASGYVAFLRTKNVVVNTVSARVLYDRLVDGTYLRQPPVEELVALSAELHHLAQTPEPPPPRHGTKEVRTCGGGAKGEWKGGGADGCFVCVLFVFCLCFVCLLVVVSVVVVVVAGQRGRRGAASL